MAKPIVCSQSNCNGIHSKRNPKYTNYASLCEGAKQMIRKAQNNPEHREKMRQFRIKYRQLCLDHYGRQCACCGEKEERFLVFDHIDNDGADHRRALGIKGGWMTCLWLIQNNFPDVPRIQVLCANCNLARTMGLCPHELL